MGVTERETNLILDNISDLKQDLRDFRENIELKLVSFGNLVQVHDSRIDDIEKKQIANKTEFECWVQQYKVELERVRHIKEVKIKRISWLIPLIATTLIGLSALTMSLLGLIFK